MRARDAAVIAVSEAANSADSSRQAKRIAAATQMFTGRGSPAPCMENQAPLRNSSSRKTRTFATSTFLAMKLCPMSRARMKVSAPRLTFLSWAMAFEDFVDVARLGRQSLRDARRQADGAQMRLDPLGGLRRTETFARGKAEGAGHADRHALAMDEAGRIVADDLFQRVTKGVAEVEQRAIALLGLVAGDHRRLGLAGDRDGVLQLRPARENRRPVALQPGEEIGAVDQAVFDHFRVAGGEFARRQRGEAAGVGEHQRGLVEGADQIFAVRGIDAGLAADRGIDLRQHGGRNLHEIHAAPQARGGEAGEIAHHAAAERDQQVAALHARVQRGFAKLLEVRKILGRFAGRQDQAAVAHAGGVEAGFERREPERADMGVGDDEHARARRELGDARAGRGDQVGTDQDVVGPVAERDGERAPPRVEGQACSCRLKILLAWPDARRAPG